MNPILLSSELIKTCKALQIRIKERFPSASLNKTCKDFIDIAEDADKTSAAIKRPNYLIRSGSWICAVILLLILVPPYIKLQVTTKDVNIADFFQMIDSSFNIIVVIGGIWFYLSTSEVRQKRKKVITAINKLKCIAHIIDAQQLTKDSITLTSKKTANSPKRLLTDYELGRYLDYCSEMLSLISKIAFLYIQDFNDPIANDSVNDLEALTIGFSQKIWQKINTLKLIPQTGKK